MPSLLRARPTAPAPMGTVDPFSRLQVRWTTSSRSTMAHLLGALDRDAAPELRAVEVVASAAMDLVLDLTDVTAVDVRGLDLLEIVAQAPNVRLYAVPPVITDLLDRTAFVCDTTWPVLRVAARDSAPRREAPALTSDAVSERIRLHVGPADAAAARDWVANRQALVDASRHAPELDTKPEVLDLLDMILGLWAVEADRGETFEWSHELDPEVLLLIARYWLDLGDLTPDERRALGVPYAPPHTEQFTFAVVAGMVDALRTIGEPAAPLLARLGIDR